MPCNMIHVCVSFVAERFLQQCFDTLQSTAVLLVRCCHILLTDTLFVATAVECLNDRCLGCIMPQTCSSVWSAHWADGTLTFIESHELQVWLDGTMHMHASRHADGQLQQ